MLVVQNTRKKNNYVVLNNIVIILYKSITQKILFCLQLNVQGKIIFMFFQVLYSNEKEVR